MCRLRPTCATAISLVTTDREGCSLHLKLAYKIYIFGMLVQIAGFYISCSEIWDSDVVLPTSCQSNRLIGRVQKRERNVKRCVRELAHVQNMIFRVTFTLSNNCLYPQTGCCFITYYTRKSALEAQNALHNMKILPGVSRFGRNVYFLHKSNWEACQVVIEQQSVLLFSFYL